MATQTSKRCFIHIGAPKTGTTYLQRLLFDNRERLRAAGLLYPDVNLRGYGHHDLAFLLNGTYPEWATPQARPLNDICRDLQVEAAFDGDLLISSENFYLFPQPSKLLEMLTRTDALRNREPRIVVYVRRQDLAHESWYNQTIKAQGYDHDLEQSINHFKDLWDYHKQLSDWAHVFGKSAMIVRVYEPQQFHGGTIEADFFDAIGRPLDGFSTPEAVVNPSLNRDLLQIQRLINRLPMLVERKRRFHRELVALSKLTRSAGLFDQRPLMTAERARTLLEHYAPGNAAIAATYFGRSNLFFDYPQTVEEYSPVPEGLTYEKIVYAIGWLLSCGDLDDGE